MAKILFLAHRIPYPPNKGDKIRSWNFLKHLCGNHEVHAGFFIDDADDKRHLSYLEQHCASVHWAFASPIAQKIASLRAFMTGRSLTEEAYPSVGLRAALKQILEEGVDCIFLYSAASRRFLPDDLNVPILTDFVDVDSAKWEAYAEDTGFPLSAVYGREARKLAQFERNLAKESVASLFASPDEASLFKARLSAKQTSNKVFGIANGVDINKFDPENYPEDQPKSKRIMFTGAMDYAPNVDAVDWFARDIFPQIKDTMAEAEFFVAGRPVAPEVQSLQSINGITIVGGVEDMAAEIARADIIVAPLKTARGIQNKVLEGMAMAKPVVCTSGANEGINAPHETAVCVSDNSVEFANAVVQLLKDPRAAKQMGQNARQFVQRHNSWEAAFKQLDAVIDDALANPVAEVPCGE